jgi:serine/threonine protein kinase
MSLVYFDFSDGAEPGSDDSSLESSSQPPNVTSILAAAGNELPLLPPTNLSFDKQLGRGSSFDVNLEIYVKPADKNWKPYYVAVKHMNLGRGSRDSLRPHYAGVQNELRVLTHPSLKDNDLILPILAYGWTNSLLGERPYLVVDYSDHGTLTQYLKRINPPLCDRRELALDVAAGLKALHDVKIIHGDVKPDNILVFDTLEMSRAQMAKLADFGGAIFELDEEQAKLYGGTALYKAPELDGRGKFQEHNRVIATKLYAADIYSFGITLWEIMKSGRSYIEESWLLNGETKRDFLHRIAEVDEDAILCRARTFCAQLLRGHSSDTISKVVEQTFEITLPDDPLRRSDIDQVLDSLGQGAQ